MQSDIFEHLTEFSREMSRLGDRVNRADFDSMSPLGLLNLISDYGEDLIRFGDRAMCVGEMLRRYKEDALRLGGE